VSMSGDVNNVVPWAMVFCVKDVGLHDQTRATALHTVFLDWWRVTQAPSTNVFTTLNEIRITDITSISGPSFVFPITPPIPGVRVGEPAGSQVSAMVTLLTPNRGRSHRGRKFVPGVVTGDIDSGGGTFMEETAAQNLTTSFRTLKDAIKALLPVGAVLAIESKKTGQAYEVLECQGRLHLGGQRGRRLNTV